MNFWTSLSLGVLLSSIISLPLEAQISPDGTTDTIVTPIDNGLRIDEGDRAGDNLFHSFEGFSVPNGSEAFFNNPNNIVNIFSRVTGGDISNIDGLINVNGDANLFLINPAGIVFGEGAALDIGGSFFSSTAESIVFSDDVEFSATDTDNAPLLTVNMPIGLNFGNNPSDIAVNGSNLQVNSGETLALFGGNVTMTGGQIEAPGANIELGGLTEAGQITFEQPEAISFPETIARGDAILTNGSEVNVQAAGRGSIDVNARNLELSGGELGLSNLKAGIAAESNSTNARAGDITLDATENITVTQGSIIRNGVEESGLGNAGGIKITATNLFLTEGGFLSGSTFGEGNAGTITINASDTISVDGAYTEGFGSGIFSTIAQETRGNSGNITITATNLFLQQGGQIVASNFGTGNAGTIAIEASDLIFIDGEDLEGNNSGIFNATFFNTEESPASEINITTANLSLTGGGQIVASTIGEGNSGTIVIKALDSIVADGEDSEGFSSGILSTVETEAIGNSGGINITTADLSLTKGGQISASTFGEGNAGEITIEASERIMAGGETQTGFSSGIFSTVEPEAIGNSGGIDISTANLSLTKGGAITASTFGEGNAGEITIEASNRIAAEGENKNGDVPSGIFSVVLESGEGNANDIDINTNNLFLNNNAEISVESLGQGEAGNLNIRTNSLTLSDNAALFASTPLGTGGNINLQIAQELILKNNSTISAQALEDADGGSITIDAQTVVAFPDRDNDIIANAARGDGGNIDITTNALFGIAERSSTPLNNTNDIDASSEFGLDGTVNINELDVNPAEELEELPAEVIDVARLVAQNLCQQGDGSEFIVTGKGGIAPNPSQARDGELSGVDLVEPTTVEAGEQGSKGSDEAGDQGSRGVEEEIVEARGWIVNDRGTLELVAHSIEMNTSLARLSNSRTCNRAFNNY